MGVEEICPAIISIVCYKIIMHSFFVSGIADSFAVCLWGIWFCFCCVMCVDCRVSIFYIWWWWGRATLWFPACCTILNWRLWMLIGLRFTRQLFGCKCWRILWSCLCGSLFVMACLLWVLNLVGVSVHNDFFSIFFFLYYYLSFVDCSFTFSRTFFMHLYYCWKFGGKANNVQLFVVDVLYFELSFAWLSIWYSKLE